ncbi:hypothetical protein ON010_g2571 [Phytophthora cinnamomi]|nr:hypothetical protein ON010_g2571 [Phytophthora cinnamomi]
MQSRRKDFDGLWRRPRALYVLGGGWILFMCWFVGSLAGFDKRVPNHHAFTIRSQDVDEYSQHQILLKVSASEHERVFEDFTVEVHTSQEVLPMGDEFYTSDYGENDTSTTIIFNVFKGRPKALAVQLMKALTQKYVTQPDVWVMCFNSPMEAKYRHVVEEVKKKFPDVADKVKYTVSDFNYKFHGRFLLAYMATTKYVLIVDDDKAIDGDTVNDYIKYMRIKKGVWGNNGHRRASTFEGYKSWPTVGYNLSTTDMEEQDYLSGMWFLEQSWLDLRSAKTLPHKPNEVQATKGSALNLREFIFDHELGRGNKVVSVDAPVKTLVYAETVGDLEDYLAKLDACPSHNSSAAINVGDITAAVVSGPWCDGGKTAAVFRGAKEQDVNGLIAAAEKLCAKTNCEYFSVKPKISHGIKYFNMREGFGQASTGVEIPFQTGASDVMLSLVGILNNVLPQTLFVPDVSSMRWPETDDAKRNRLQIYHRTVLLAVDIHRSSKTNGKWVHRGGDTDPFPTEMRTFVWQNEMATLYEG